MTQCSDVVTAVVLAGGRARRLDGRDKGLIEINNKPMIAYILAALAGQTHETIINANRNPDKYSGMGCRVIPDRIPGYCGPLAGMASAMHICNTRYLLTVPCDSPLIAGDLAARLYAAIATESADIAVAHDGRRLQPVFCLLKTGLRDSIETFLSANRRKIDRWFEEEKYVAVDFSDQPDMFINVNTPEDLSLLQTQLADGRDD